jgi:catechol 2,3-dioxygenase-like lactoylglutathione lyase family enzyme
MIPPMALRLGHDHVALRVVDYEAAVDWYTTKLDFTIDQQWPFGDMKLAYLSNGRVKIEILGASEAELQLAPTSLGDTFGTERVHHFCIAVDDLDATVEELRRRGVSFLAEPFVVEEIGRRLAFITDNSGNMIELSAPKRDA